MPKIIYKQQHVGDNGRKFSASRNAHYVKYIGEREHVLKTSHETNLVKYMGEREHAAKRIDKMAKEDKKNQQLTTYDVDSMDTSAAYDEDIEKASGEMFAETDNGLFGVINGSFSDNYSTAEMQQYVRRISTPHRNVFHSVFSFTPESAEEAGLKTLDDWESWVKYHISDIANGMNMKIENIEYLAAVHLKEGQPHVHIMWWNKSQQVLINKVEPLICDAIRIAVIKSTYREEFNALHNEEDRLIRTLRSMITNQTESMLTELITDEYTETIAKGLNHISDILPKSGQLVYMFMESEIKTEIDKLTHYIIDNNPQFSQLYDNILEQRRLYNEMLHSTESDASNWSKYKLAKYFGTLNDDIERSMGNALLKIIKRERKAGRQRMIDALDAVPIQSEPDGKFHSERWIDYSERESYEPYIRWTKRFKEARSAASGERYDEAFKLYTKEAETGNILAEYEIADLYRRKLINGEDKSEAHYQKALAGFLVAEQNAEKLKPYLQYRIGRMFYDGYGTQQNYAEALIWLTKSAEGGNYLAANTLAKMYKEGIGTEENIDNAIQWYENAAKNNAYSSYSLGRIYFYGNGVRIDYREAEKHLLRAAENELNCAEFLLGKIYSSDDKNMRNTSKAAFWFEKAAEHGNADAAYRLSVVYSEETDIDIFDRKKSQYWLSKAIELYTANAEAGNSFAALALGRIYADNTGSAYNPVLAERWLKAASESDDECAAQAEYILAKLLMSDDVCRYADAVEWLTKSYNHGNNNAAFALAKILSDEKTKLIDLKAAQDWLEKAKSGAEKNLIEQLHRNSVEADIESVRSWISYAEKNLDLQCGFILPDGTDVTEVFLQQVQESRLSEAEYKLGMLFLREDYLNYELAERHLRTASVLHNPYAMYALAKLYLKDDIPNIHKNQETAINLLENAKVLDKDISPFADYTLGAMYMFDSEFHDKELAMKYLTLSAQAGNQYAQNLIDNAALWKQRSIIKLLSSVMNILEANRQDGEAYLSAASEQIFGRGDLSKEEIAELILKLQDKQNTAEM